MSAMVCMPVEAFQKSCKAQGVSSREHCAVKCVVCGTVQSIASFKAFGASEDDADKFIGFSCVGRLTNAGPFKQGSQPGTGCDWSLGGLFTIHKLEIETPDGKRHPHFELASPEEAQALEAQHSSAPASIALTTTPTEARRS